MWIYEETAESRRSGNNAIRVADRRKSVDRIVLDCVK